VWSSRIDPRADKSREQRSRESIEARTRFVCYLLALINSFDRFCYC
jgi:hypothetical protein